MSANDQKTAALRDHQARKRLDEVKQLKQCTGWTDWIAPKIYQTYDQACERIKDCLKQAKMPEQADVHTFAALNEIVEETRQTVEKAQHRLGATT